MNPNDGGSGLQSVAGDAILDQSGSHLPTRRQLDAENQRLAAFARCNPNPVLEFEGNGAISYANDAAREMAARLQVKSPSDLLPPDFRRIVSGCLTTRENRLRVETRVAERMLSWSFFPVESGNVVHGYAGDITDRLNLEAQLRQSQKMESVGQLAAGVAHDFNNILTAIQGFSSLLLHDLTDPRQRESALQISTAAERAANLTRQLLTFSRRQLMQPRNVDLNECVNSVTKMLRRILGEDVVLQCNYQSALPPIYADSGMIEQIILNLAVNARDAMPNGGMLSISTRLQEFDAVACSRNPEARLGRFACLTVSDNGHGMDDATLSRIFEPFFTTKGVGKGTGLGLATVYGIVQQHEGWLTVRSQPGEGTSFDVLLPLCTREEEPLPMVLRDEPQQGGGETILVVEDEPALRDLAREILMRYGYTVLEAANGPEALQVWSNATRKIDLMITDMVMPGGITGEELARELGRRQPGLKVVFMTGYSLEVLKRSRTLPEEILFLQKPYAPSHFLGMVRTALESNGLATRLDVVLPRLAS